MANILDVTFNLVENPKPRLKDLYKSKNRANSMGEALEKYIKDIFCNTVNSKEKEAINKYEEIFSYLGNQNNPPDIMLKKGDAIKIKKIESRNSALALNSSFPKSRLYSDSP